MSSNICLLALIGLPAAGKTSFSQMLLAQAETRHLPKINFIHLCYDNMLNLKSTTHFSEFAYKLHREKILQKINEIVDDLKLPAILKQLHVDNVNVANKNNSTYKYILICDDNNYYRSMRYKLYQLCRKQQISYAQIYFDCSLQEVAKRNSNRPEQDFVPPSVLERMSRCMEIPLPMKMKWEKNTYVLDANRVNYENVWNFLRACFNNIPAPILPQSSNFKSNLEPQSSLHKLDLLLRKRVNELLQNVNVIEKSAKAKEFNETRKEILEIFKNSASKQEQENDLFLYVDMLF